MGEDDGNPLRGWSGRYGVRVPPDLGADVTRLEFMITEVEVTDAPPPAVEFYDPGRIASAALFSDLPTEGEEEGRRAAAGACTVHVFAVEASGASALLQVSGFRPHLTYQVPHARRASLLEAVARAARLRGGAGELRADCRRVHHLHGWQPSADDPTVKRLHEVVRVSFPTVGAFRAALRHGAVLGAAPWEGKVDPAMMFFDQTGLVPCGWLRLARAARGPARGARASHCGYELRCAVADLVPLPARMDVAPLLVASVDIECYSASGGFPDCERPADRVAIIGTSFWRVGERADAGPARTVLLCVTGAPAVEVAEEGVTVERFATEGAMLEAWRDLVAVHADPDLVVGYNTFGFDFRYLRRRAELAACPRYPFLSRLAAERARPAVRELSSNALGDNEMHTLGWRGRVDLDLMGYVRAQHKLARYSLDAVSLHFLGERKVDLPYAELFGCLADGAPAEAMARACAYCAEDCRLPLKLMRRLEVVPAMVEMSRVTYTTLNQLVFRGQQIKVFNQLVRTAHACNCVLNPPPAPSADDEGYQGATVIEPTPGFYDTPVATLDFASLYPSIMMAHNLCFSTRVVDPAHLGLPGVRYETHETGGGGGADGAPPPKRNTFVLSTPGVLPRILRELLAARKAAKRAMADATDPSLRALYNARQLALKVSCNSVYGFTGAARRGMYADVAIADSVTRIGRAMIETTARTVEAEADCTVIYGDTDSVMIRFNDASVGPEAAAREGERLADAITRKFRLGITLEFEKIYWPYLLIAKKRYAGVMYTVDREGALQREKIDAKGVELVRRDNCPFAKAVYKGVLDGLLVARSPPEAVAHLRAQLRRLVDDEVPLDDFVLTKQLKKKESYVNEQQPHLLVADKIRERSGGAVVPQPGDRLPFYIAAPAAGRRSDEAVSLRAEDPEWGRAHAVKPDRLYYLKHQVVNPVSTLFTPFPDLAREVKAALDGAAGALSLQAQRQRTLTDFFGASAPSAGGVGAAVDAFAPPPRRPAAPPAAATKRPRRG